MLLRYENVKRAMASHVLLVAFSFTLQIPRPIVGGKAVTYRTCTPPSVQMPPTPSSNYVALDEVSLCAPLVGMFFWAVFGVLFEGDGYTIRFWHTLKTSLGHGSPCFTYIDPSQHVAAPWGQSKVKNGFELSEAWLLCRSVSSCRSSLLACYLQELRHLDSL